MCTNPLRYVRLQARIKARTIMRPAYAPKTMAGKPPSVVVPAAMPPAYSSAQPVPADYSTSMTAKMTVAPNYAQPQAVSMVWL